MGAKHLKRIGFATIACLVAIPAVAQDAAPPPTRDEVAAACNVQLGQTFTNLGQNFVNLGQSQHHVIDLQTQLDKATKDAAAASEAATAAQKSAADKEADLQAQLAKTQSDLKAANDKLASMTSDPPK